MKKILILIIGLIFLSGCNSIYLLNNIESQVIVNSADDLAGELDPDKVYVIDGVIDMGNTSIIVPSGGLAIAGSGLGSFGVSGFFSSADDYTLFTYNESSYSGDLFISGGLELTVTGNNSKIYNLNNKQNFGAIETNEVNYNACDEIGTIANYRQALGINIGVFGCTEGLTFEGTWAGGVRYTAMIVRGFGETGTIFRAGDNLTFNSRFLTDVNADFNNGANLADFNESNFLQDGLFQLKGATVTRGGSINFTTDYLPNIDRTSSKSFFEGNVGLKNTFIGSVMNFDTAVLTPLTQNTPAKALGVTIYSNEQHFNSGSLNNSIEYDSSLEIDVEITGQLTVEVSKNDAVDVIINKYQNSTGSYVEVNRQEMNVINQIGIDDLGIFNIYTITSLNEGDRIEVWLENTVSNTDATVYEDSYIIINER